MEPSAILTPCAGKLEETLAGSTAVEAWAAVSSHLLTWEEHTLRRAQERRRPPRSRMLCATTSEADELPQLLQIRAAAGICIQRLGWTDERRASVRGGRRV